MTFDLPDAWVWDFWLADDGDRYHVFFLYASRALKEPDRRHYRAQIGHAVSGDLVHWDRVTDALVRADPPAFDDLATWTGSVVCDDAGLWHLFYTGATRSGPDSNVQRIGHATSPDLFEWDRSGAGAVLEAAPPYERITSGAWHDEAFRDPWVFRDPAGSGWHMLVTARLDDGDPSQRGVIAHAVSPDLSTWTLQAPLSPPGAGFGHLEVPQVAQIDGQAVLLFSCGAGELAPARREGGATGGIWAAPAQSLTGPFDIGAAYQVTDQSLYSGRLVQDRAGRWCLLAFRHDGTDGAFLGGIVDPMPVGMREGRLVVL